jgi:hypothetical protein
LLHVHLFVLPLDLVALHLSVLPLDVSGLHQSVLPLDVSGDKCCPLSCLACNSLCHTWKSMSIAACAATASSCLTAAYSAPMACLPIAGTAQTLADRHVYLQHNSSSRQTHLGAAMAAVGQTPPGTAQAAIKEILLQHKLL